MFLLSKAKKINYCFEDKYSSKHRVNKSDKKFDKKLYL